MLVALPASCFVLIVLNLLSRRNPDVDIRSVFLSAAVVWGAALVLITETLSLFGSLSVEGLATSWGTLTAISAAYLARRQGGIPHWKPRWPGLLAVTMMLPIAAVVLGTGLIAAVGWPSQSDSMIYHLSRVDHWIQDRTVGFYPTHIIRQLYNPPWAEYAILHFRVLGGDERWAHAPQWFSMVGSIIGVSAIAQRLGAPPGGQLFSALFAATIPMGILQAPGTQNDYVTALWLVCMTEAALLPPSRARSFQIGASLGLAVLSKGTALIFAGPLVLTMPHLTTGAWRTRVRRAARIALVAMMLNVPHWARNIDTFGSPLGPGNLGSADGIKDQLTNEAISPGILLSNVARNLSLHAGTRFRRVNVALENTILQGHTWLGLSVNDPRTTRIYGKSHFEIGGTPADPDQTGNPLHLALILLTTACVAISPALRRRQHLVRLSVALAIAFLLFCLTLKWQPWHSRLHLPLFVLASPLVGVTWGSVSGMMWVATILLGACAIPPLLHNRLAPLTGPHTILNTPRLHQQFASFGGGGNRREHAYIAAAQALGRQKCSDVGLILGWDDWEHPLWILISEGTRRAARINHVAVVNRSAALANSRPGFAPCAIVVGSVPVTCPIKLGPHFYTLYHAAEGLSVYALDDRILQHDYHSGQAVGPKDKAPECPQPSRAGAM